MTFVFVIVSFFIKTLIKNIKWHNTTAFFTPLWDDFRIIAILSCFLMSSFSQLAISLKTNSNISSGYLTHFHLKIQFVIYVVSFQLILYILCLLVGEHIPTFSAYSLEIQSHFLHNYSVCLEH